MTDRNIKEELLIDHPLDRFTLNIPPNIFFIEDDDIKYEVTYIEDNIAVPSVDIIANNNIK